MTERERKNSSTPQQYVWEQGWEDHNRKQLERLAILPLSDKLQWLEEAQRLVLHLQHGLQRRTQ